MRRLVETAAVVAPSNAPVLILGESGSGKGSGGPDDSPVEPSCYGASGGGPTVPGCPSR